MKLSTAEEREILNACHKAMSYWTVKSQFISLLEEMGELQVLIAKAANDKQSRVEDFTAKVVDEMADVYFMLSQLELIFSNAEEVKQRLLFKCAQTVKRVDNDYVK